MSLVGTQMDYAFASNGCCVSVCRWDGNADAETASGRHSKVSKSAQRTGSVPRTIASSTSERWTEGQTGVCFLRCPVELSSLGRWPTHDADYLHRPAVAAAEPLARLYAFGVGEPATRSIPRKRTLPENGRAFPRSSTQRIRRVTCSRRCPSWGPRHDDLGAVDALSTG